VPDSPVISTVASVLAIRRQPLDLALECEVLERAEHRDLEGLGLDRLVDEVVRARAHRRDRDIEPAVAREHDRRRVRVALGELRAQLDAGHLRHLDVGDHHVHGLAPEALETLLTGEAGVDVEAALLQDVAQKQRGILLVVDDEDASICTIWGGHGNRP
jgi:hypothetical protein